MSFVISAEVLGATRDEIRAERGRIAGRIALELQARIPVRTGRARASIDGGQTLPEPPGKSGPYLIIDPDVIARDVAKVDPAIAAEVGIGVPYANLLRLGHSPKAPEGWVDEALVAAGVETTGSGYE